MLQLLEKLLMFSKVKIFLNFAKEFPKKMDLI